MIELPSPLLVVFGGPNGAGKTTTARELLPIWKIGFFLNADLLAAAIAHSRPSELHWRQEGSCSSNRQRCWSGERTSRLKARSRQRSTPGV